MGYGVCAFNYIMGTEFEILKKIRSGTISEQELVEIYECKKDRYNILFHLVQHPRFPERFSLNIIADLFAMDLVRVIKNTRTRPYVRKRAELGFKSKYSRFPLGEKLSYMKIAPLALLDHFVEEQEKLVIEAILKNGYCTEGLVLKFINRKSQRYEFYQALDTTEWYKRPQVAEAISMDEQASIKIMIKIIPYLSLNQLKTLYKRSGTHGIVKRNILNYIREKKFTNE
jgi:hypothetical protein